VIDEHMDALDSLDVDRLLTGLTEDILEMPSNMSRVIGKQAYKEFFKPWIVTFNSLKHKEMSFEADEFIVSGDWAFQIGTYSYKFIFHDDNVMEDEGNYVWIFKKETEGHWKWARVISNSSKPLPVSE
jgi:ketosteroid isomerase-like protein